ncbi:hypothetical protein C1645_823867 [Glomus cerebriforme]|uniref:Uncharacterized protein n=1 Tax=Glomus cerebriforme TaxID=658196 RepID=A0A397SVL3_9GLOM|nr:hypothetical protein C1645_823867 [Glomus cerebriforme]
MSQKHNANKKQGFRRVLKPVFVNTSELPSSPISQLNPSGSSIVGNSVNNPDVTAEFSSNNINKKENLIATT